MVVGIGAGAGVGGGGGGVGVDVGSGGRERNTTDGNDGADDGTLSKRPPAVVDVGVGATVEFRIAGSGSGNATPSNARSGLVPSLVSAAAAAAADLARSLRRCWLASTVSIAWRRRFASALAAAAATAPRRCGAIGGGVDT